MGERIKCKKCGEKLQSKYRHDFKMCKCETCYIDGGDDYCKKKNKKEDIEWLDRKEKNKKITELENILKPILDLNIPINTLINEFERLNELEDNMEISKLKSKDKKVKKK